MLHLRDFVIPLLAAIVVGILVWAYLDRPLKKTFGGKSNAVFPDRCTLSTLARDRYSPAPEQPSANSIAGRRVDGSRCDPEIVLGVRFVSAPGPIFFPGRLGMGIVGEPEIVAPILILIATAQLTVGIVLTFLPTFRSAPCIGVAGPKPSEKPAHWRKL
jgi:hypothetical protein